MTTGIFDDFTVFPIVSYGLALKLLA